VLGPVLDRMAGVRVAVIGEAMLDSYSSGVVSRICPEAPVPVVDVQARDDAPGGAANAAANVASLNGRVQLVSAIGPDPEGDVLMAAMRAAGIDCDGVLRTAARKTLSKHRVSAGTQVLLRFDQGTTSNLASAEECDLLERLRAAWSWAEAVIVADYNYGILTPALIAALAELRQSQPRLLLVDSRRLAAYHDVHATVVKPNSAEAASIAGVAAADRVRHSADAEAGAVLLDRTGAEMVVVTNDRDGACLFRRGQAPVHRPAAHSGLAHPAGAGDTFGAAFAMALASGAEAEDALEVASVAAGIVVASDGTSRCGLAELRARLLPQGKVIRDRGALRELVAERRAAGRRVVLTNGCFDILLPGHVAVLEQSRRLGDVLIVGVNSDASARAVKGAGRTVNPLEARMEVLSGLSCVDYVVPFEEVTADELIRATSPDVFTKGENHAASAASEAALVEAMGGEVRFLAVGMAGSTADVIRRIRHRSPRPTRAPAQA
jgi:D-beta-D-heptose 7-phosphate kinase/D-beta-D-heptose 1-phosphate adenosyltransferase